MLRRTVSILLAATAAGAVLSAPAKAAAVCPDPDDRSFFVGWEIPYPETHGREPDRLAISPATTRSGSVIRSSSATRT